MKNLGLVTCWLQVWPVSYIFLGMCASGTRVPLIGGRCTQRGRLNKRYCGEFVTESCYKGIIGCASRLFPTLSFFLFFNSEAEEKGDRRV